MADNTDMPDWTTPNREALLRALLDSATELSSLHDVEAVLLSIARRTRQLLRSDMAYISLNDHQEGITYIRQSDGVLTHAYRTIRMPIGTGILGLVASGEAAYQTTDYLRDESVTHIPEIDQTVAQEGVRTIMGVPLVMAGRVIGALMVAERSHRVFSPEEVETVDSLGKHAAVALDNAEKYAQALRDAEQLSVKNARSQQQLLSVTEVAQFDEDLMQAILQNPSPEGVLEVTAGRLGAALTLLNERGEVIAGPPGASSRVITDQVVQNEMRSADALGTVQAVEVRGPDAGTAESQSVLLVPVRSGRSTLGYLLAMGLPQSPAADGRSSSPAVNPAQQTLLSRAAAHCALALLFLQAEEDAQYRAQLDVLDELLSGEIIPRSRLDRRLRHWGMTSSDRAWVALIDHPAGHERAVQRQFRALPGTRLLAEVEGHLCVVFTEAAWIEEFQQLGSASAEVRAVYCGPMNSVTQLPRFHRRALTALSALRYSARTGLVDAASIGVVGTVIHLMAASDESELTREIQPLLDYDAERGTSLTATALQYFDSDRRIDRTAESLFVHRNTVKQRLGSIARLLGAGWDCAPRALDVHLSLRVWGLSAMQQGLTSGQASASGKRL